MTSQTIAYFTSIVLTFLLTGALAGYAWRQRSLPVARPYAWLALSESLLALTEIISMLSPNEATARFWFNTRYLFGAAMPVFFFLFALDYNARIGWHSKPLLLGLFALPLFSQVMVWTNPLHHMWVVQDVGFFQEASFWLNDTTVRVPGLWFLVHNLYGLSLMLVGIVILLVAAWGKKRRFLGQSLLLTAGAVVGILASVIPSFNLVPNAKFNPFVPGIGLSALLYAFAILGHDFLKHFPGKESAPSTTAQTRQEKHNQAVFLLIFVLVISGFATAGILSYSGFQREYRTQIETQLLSIASLKVNELENWRDERQGNGEVFLGNPSFAALVESHLEAPSDPLWSGQLQAWLDTTCESYKYHRILLLDIRGGVRIASPAGLTTVPEHIVDELPSTLQSGQVTFQDLHLHPDGNIYLGLLVPIYSEQDPTVALGMLVMEIDPTVYLYPYLVEWPVPSQTGETLLVRRDGDEVLFLNPLRFDPDAALNLRVPLTDTQVLSVKAVLGETGIVEGLDYRGEQVLGAVAPVTGTPWFIVARMDQAEAYAPLRTRLWETYLIFGALIIACGTGLGFAWRQQGLRQYRERLRLAEALQDSEEKFRKAFQISPEGITITRLADGKFILVNQGFEQILGYSEQEVIGKTSVELDIWVNPADRERIVAELQAAGSVINFEAQFRHKDGEIRYGLMSVVAIEL